MWRFVSHDRFLVALAMSNRRNGYADGAQGGYSAGGLIDGGLVPETKAVVSASRACSRCGAQVTVQAGAEFHCPFCGHRERFATIARGVRSYPVEVLSKIRTQFSNQVPPSTFTCSQCGGRTRERALATLCPYCHSPMVMDVKTSPLIAPEAMLRFELDEGAARSAIRQWIGQRSFAPNALRKVADAENMASWYLPYWVFDMQIHARYEGTCGSRRTNSSREDIDFHQVSGSATHHAIGVGHEASGAAARGDLAMMRFRLSEVQPFQPDYMRGHRAPCYVLEPEQSFEALQPVIDAYAMDSIKRAIGGEVQIVNRHENWTTDVKLQLCYLPVWACSYVYRGKSWSVLVNGDSGVVSGARPFSKPKIAAAIFTALIVLPAPVVLAAIFLGSWAWIVAIAEFFAVVSLDVFVNNARCTKAVFAAIDEVLGRRRRV